MTMKKFLLCLSLSLAMALGAAPGTALKNKKHQAAWDGTFVLYGTSESVGKTLALCSAFIYEKTADGYKLLTAGHCFLENGAPADVKYSIDTDVHEKPELQPVTLLRAIVDGTTDAAEIELKTKNVYPVLHLADALPNLEDKVYSVGFPETVEKEIVAGQVTGLIIPTVCDEGDLKICKGRFILSLPGGPGASGSPILSEKSGQVLGILEGIVGRTNVVIMPTKTIKQWLDKK